MIKKILISTIILLYAISNANAQTGIWSGKLDIQGTKLSLVFNLDHLLTWFFSMFFPHYFIAALE